MFLNDNEIEIYLLSCISNAQSDEERERYEHLYSLWLCGKYTELYIDEYDDDIWKGDEW